MEKFLDHLIQNFFSAAAFKSDDDDLIKPIGWMYMSAHGGGGWHYVDKEFQGKGISNALWIELIRQIPVIENGDIAMGNFDKEHVGLACLTGGVAKKVIGSSSRRGSDSVSKRSGWFHYFSFHVITLLVWCFPNKG